MSSFFDSASLVQIPSGYSDGTLYSVKPIDGSGDLTFSRGSDIEATRVASNGYIEKAKVNLVLQSNTFSTTWANTRSTESSGYAGYDGTNNAWKLEEDSNTGTHLLQQNVVSSAGVHTISCYFKAAERSGVQFLLEGSASYAFANFNLSTGAVHSSGQSGSFTLLDAKITSIGGGWYRCSVSASTGVATSWVKIYTLDAGFNTSYTGTTGEGIYIQDAQMNYGLVAQEYVETTTTSVVSGITNDLPRLDYSGGASCPSLLLEPSRSNALTHTEYLNGLPDVSNVVVTTNATTSPEGVVNASKVVASAVNNFHWVGINTSVSNGVVYTASVFAKSAEYEHLYIVLRTDSGAKRYGVKFDLSNGTFVDDITFGSPTQTSYAIEEYPNGWYRCSVSTYHTSGNIVALFGPSLGGNVTDINNQFLGDGTSGIYMYGTSAENGPYMTSLIPCYGTSASRTADACSKTGISSLIGQTEGTLFVEVDYTNTGESQTYITISDGTINNRITLSYSLTLNCLNAFARVGGSTQALMTSATSPANGIKKIAVAYKLNDYRLYINGTEVAVDSTALVPTCSRIDVGSLLATGNESSVKQAILFPTRLSNSDLAALTA